MSVTDRPLLPAATLMDELERIGVRFALDPGGEPVFRAPHGALTEAHREALSEQRENIRELLAIVGPACWAPHDRAKERTAA